MSTKVDVTGIDRRKLLLELWRNAKPAFLLSWEPTPNFDIDEALGELNSGYADYICGRCIKVNVMSKEKVIDGKLYDREYGPGSFQKVVNRCKETEK